MQTFSALGRRKIRYWCFRLHTESIGAAKADGCPEDLRNYFENHTWFLGWKNYGITWDVSETNPLDIVPLKKSLEETWNSEARTLAKDFPINSN